MAKQKPRAGKAPAYQWYPGDALADEAVATMTLEEEGAYRRLLDYHWREGSIPADPEELRRLCKWISPRRFAEIWSRIGARFAPAEHPGRLINQRAAAQREEAETYRAEQKRKSDLGNAKLAELRKTDNPAGISAGGQSGTSPGEPEKSSGDPSAICDLRSASSSGSKEPERAAGAAPPRMAAKQVKARTDRAHYIHPELGKPENAKQRRVVDIHLAAARQVIDAVNAGRKRVRDSSRGIGASYTSLAEIAGRLDAGRTVEECLHVVAICEAESKANPEKSFPYFNTISPFIAKNFERLAARDIESAGRAPAPLPDRFQRPDAPRPPPPEFNAPERPSVPDDPEARRRVVEFAKGAA